MGRKQPGRWGSQPRTPTHKSPSHLCTMQAVTPQGKGVEEHTSGYLPGATPSHWHHMEGRTNRGTDHVYNDQAGPHPGAAPSTAGSFTRPPLPTKSPAPDLMGPQKKKERSCYLKVGACTGMADAGIPRQAWNLGISPGPKPELYCCATHFLCSRNSMSQPTLGARCVALHWQLSHSVPQFPPIKVGYDHSWSFVRSHGEHRH